MDLTQEMLNTKLADISKKSMLVASGSSHTTRLKIIAVVADQITVAYDTMPGNQPNSYGNYVVIWQNSNVIPYNTEPLKAQPIVSNTPTGDMIFSGLNVSVNSYILGYAVSPGLAGSGQQKQGNVCATAYVPALGGTDGSEFAPTLTILSIGANSVAVGYELPTGNLPQTNGAWIGIWRAAQASYNNPPDAANSIQVNAAEGSAFINGITIGRGLTYTVGLFMSGWGNGSTPNNQKSLATSVTFTAK